MKVTMTGENYKNLDIAFHRDGGNQFDNL